MILTAKKIREEVKNGNITIHPYSEELLNPNSYNYRLGDFLSVIEDAVIDPQVKQSVSTFKIPSEGYVLEPRKVYLGHTLEVIGSSKYVASLIGRSSIGRLGLYLQITADLGQLGDAHCWTLELKVVQPLRVYPRMRIGQLSFWKPSGNIISTYSGGYTSYNMPEQSRIHKGSKE